MPNVKSLDEFNRSQKEILEEIHEKGEPLYLTRDGSACVVVMDAAAFDEAMGCGDDLREEEFRVECDVLRGAAEVAAGDFVDADVVYREIRDARGWQ